MRSPSRRDAAASATAPFDSLNLGRSTHDDPENVRREPAPALRGDPAPIRAACDEPAGARCAPVNRARGGRARREGDGLWTDEPGVPMLAFTADCLPIALARLNGRRRRSRSCTLAGSACSTGDPGGGRRRARRQARCSDRAGNRSLLLRSRRGDRRPVSRALWRARSCADATSISGPPRSVCCVTRASSRVERLDLCTACDPERFFSHRRDGPVTGRQGVIGYVA